MNDTIRTVISILAFLTAGILLYSVVGGIHFDTPERRARAERITEKIRATIMDCNTPPSANGVMLTNFNAKGKCEPTDIDYTINFTFTRGNYATVIIKGQYPAETYNIRSNRSQGLSESQHEYFDNLENELDQAFQVRNWTREE